MSQTLLFKTMLLPYLDYGTVFLTKITVAQHARLQVLQNNSLRICFNVNNPQEVHVKELHSRAKVLPLELRRIYLQNTTCHRLLYIGNLDTLPCTGTRATGAPVIRQKRPKQNYLLHNPTYQAFARWNCLQPDVRWTLDKKAFKKQILTKLIAYFHQRWQNDNTHLVYTGVDVKV